MKFFFLSIAVLLINFSVYSQITEKQKLQVDSLFAKWDKHNTPGAAIVIVKEGKIAYSNGYGMANLEYDIQITPNTIFHIASVSKQFMSYCMVLLAQQGKLSFDDDIREYLDYIPDFGETITIRQLIHHTSGLRDQWQLLAISGTRLDDVIRQDHILNMVKHQKRLNFKPGEKHMYCNTGYTLLGEIIKEVSGQSPRAFADSALFKPLGMNDTHFHDNYKELVKNRAYSYSQTDSLTFENSVLSYSTIGATSLYTTVNDFAKWLLNSDAPTVGNSETVQQMYEKGILNSGDTLNYAFGVVVDNYKGWHRVSHSGGDAGFRTYAVRFPEQSLGIAVFSNHGSFNPTAISLKVADLILPDKVKIPEKNEDTKLVTDVEINADNYTEYIGHFINDERGFIMELYRENDGLFINSFGSKQKLKPLAEKKFSIFNDEVIIDLKAPSQIEASEGNTKVIFERYTPYHPTGIEAKEYTGTFFSRETNTFYEIAVKDSSLVLRNLKYGEVKMEPIKKDRFLCPFWWMERFDFTRGANEKINGFEVNCGRIRHLLFEKQ